MSRTPFLLLLVLAGALAACGDDEPPQPAGTGLCDLSTADAVDRLGRLATPVRELAYGQEVWISWIDGKQTFGYRYPRSKPEALALARRLCRAFDAGADIGDLAREHSNAPGGRAHGFCVLPRNTRNPDLRDRALLLTPVNKRTPLLEWNGGFWFARRVALPRGRQLEERFRHTMEQRARARAIVFLHDGAFPRRVRDKPYPQAQAVAHAKGVLEALAEGKTFEDLAKRYSHDGASAARGGVLHATRPRPTESPEWIRWGDRGYPQRLLDVMLEEGPVGRVYPKPLLTKRGVMVVEVLERYP